MNPVITVINQRIAQHLPARLINALTKVRSLALLLPEQIDRMGLLVTRKRRLPPLHIRRFVGLLRGFQIPGTEWARTRKLLTILNTSPALWDIGCGCGLVAIELQPYLLSDQGSGINKPYINCCQRRIKEPNTQFIFHHMHNASYNQHATIVPQTAFLVKACEIR